jgi:hypothetical protein
MRRHWKLCALAAAACAFALGAFVGTGFGSGGSGYSAPATVMPSHASPAGKLVSEKGGGGEPAIKHFTAKSRTVNTGTFDLVRAKCPKDFPNPITGGEFTSGPGLSLINLSRKNPAGKTKDRSMYIAVLNVTPGPVKWKPEVVCGKNIKG